MRSRQRDKRTSVPPRSRAAPATGRPRCPLENLALAAPFACRDIRSSSASRPDKGRGPNPECHRADRCAPAGVGLFARWCPTVGRARLDRAPERPVPHDGPVRGGCDDARALRRLALWAEESRRRQAERSPVRFGVARPPLDHPGPLTARGPRPRSGGTTRRRVNGGIPAGRGSGRRPGPGSESDRTDGNLHPPSLRDRPAAGRSRSRRERPRPPVVSGASWRHPAKARDALRAQVRRTPAPRGGPSSRRAGGSSADHPASRFTPGVRRHSRPRVRPKRAPARGCRSHLGICGSASPRSCARARAACAVAASA